MGVDCEQKGIHVLVTVYSEVIVLVNVTVITARKSAEPTLCSELELMTNGRGTLRSLKEPLCKVDSISWDFDSGDNSTILGST
jgi:hypothetical protein